MSNDLKWLISGYVFSCKAAFGKSLFVSHRNIDCSFIIFMLYLLTSWTEAQDKKKKNPLMLENSIFSYTIKLLGKPNFHSAFSHTSKMCRDSSCGGTLLTTADGKQSHFMTRTAQRPKGGKRKSLWDYDVHWPPPVLFLSAFETIKTIKNWSELVSNFAFFSTLCFFLYKFFFVFLFFLNQLRIILDTVMLTQQNIQNSSTDCVNTLLLFPADNSRM